MTCFFEWLPLDQHAFTILFIFFLNGYFFELGHFQFDDGAFMFCGFLAINVTNNFMGFYPTAIIVVFG